MSVYKTIAKNFAANSFGMGVNFLNQIAMVPLFITHWGIDKYADWILITAFSSFFAMTDMGLNRASNNEFVIKYQQKDYSTCIKLQTNSFLFVLSVFAAFMVVAIFISLVWGFKGLLGIKVFSEMESSVAFILLLSEVFLTMYGRVYHGVLRATSRTHVAIIIDNVVRLAVLVILFFGIFFKVDLITLLILYLSPTVAGILFKHYYSSRIFAVKLSYQNFDSKVFKSLMKPSLAFMMFPLGQAVSSQGLVFVVNTVLGPSVLVAFTTTRTLVNFLRQLMNMLSTSINPEICAAYGRKDTKTIINIYYRSLLITFASTMACIIVLLFVGEYIYHEWTKHAIMFNAAFFTGMLFVLLVSCLWGMSSVIPLATNTHGPFTIAFLISQVTAVVLCFVILKVSPRMELIPFVLLVTEMALFIVTLRQNNRFLHINFRRMYQELWHQTKFLFLKGMQLIHVVHYEK
jgi:O-antigen/teichoic acid export membrane protein